MVTPHGRHHDDEHAYYEDGTVAAPIGSALQRGLPTMAVALIAWMLSCYGATLVVTSGKIFASARRRITQVSPFLGIGIHCSMCVGFWVGVVMSKPFGANVGARIESGLASSAVCWIAHVVLARLGAEDL